MRSLKLAVVLCLVLVGFTCNQNPTSTAPIPAVGIHGVALAWNKTTTRTDGSPVSPQSYYKIYRSQDGLIYSLLKTGIPITTLSYIDGTVSPNRKYWYFATAYDPSVAKESVPSNKVSTTVTP